MHGAFLDRRPARRAATAETMGTALACRSSQEDTCMRRAELAALGLLALVGLAGAEARGEPAVGDVITAANAGQLEGWIPDEIRPYLAQDFPELRMRVAEAGDYTPHAAYVDATVKYACQPRLDERGNLVDYVAGQPFPYSEWAKEATGHRCDLSADDPQFALKLAWNVNYRWQGSGFNYPQWGFSYMRNGGKDLWRLGQGVYRRTYFSHRADLLPKGHELVEGTDVEWAEFIEVLDPFDLRGTMFLLFRYTDPKKEDDTWAYVPSLRRVRRISTTQKSDSLLGTEFTFEDFYLFAGYVLDQKWTFGGESRKLGALNSDRKCFPANLGEEFQRRTEGFIRLASEEEWSVCKWGPFGALPFIDERWEKRNVFMLEDVPKQKGHPYSLRKIWYDKETLWPFYSLTYDRAGNPYKLFAHVSVWTEDDSNPINHDKRVIMGRALTGVNLQSMNSHVTQFYTSNVYPFDGEASERFFDVTRLKKQAR
jgi:hypothetical protein